MARRGEKKIDTWDFMVEGRTFGVDVYIVRPLYPPALWIYRELDGRDQANAKKKELVLIAREGWRLPDDGE